MLSAAELALSARIPDLRVADVRTALWERRSLVKVHGLRSTIHLVGADDVALHMAAMRAHPVGTRRRLAEVPRSRPCRGRAAARRHRRRPRPPPAHPRGAGCRGRGPGRGVGVRADAVELGVAAGSRGVRRAPLLRPEPRRQGHLRPPRPVDRRLGGPRSRGVDGRGRPALPAAYGPAAEADVAAWLGMRPADARPFLDALRPELAQVSVVGRPGWCLAAARPRRPRERDEPAGSPPADPAAPAPVRQLHPRPPPARPARPAAGQGPNRRRSQGSTGARGRGVDDARRRRRRRHLEADEAGPTDGHHRRPHDRA